MIFNLFKSKPTLKELIPDGFVDIHSHILPGIDDGAKNVEESLELISKMKEMGFSKIIGTPHTYPGLYNNTNESIENSFNKIRDKINDISYASEYMIDKSLIEKAQKQTLLCLKNKDILVEQSFIYENLNFFDIIFNLRLYGYSIVLAHPERYLYYHNSIKNYYKLKKMGCKFQINLLSATGHYGKKVADITDKLLKHELVDFVGSDIHNINHCNKFKEKVIINKIGQLKKAINNNKDYFT